MPQDNWYLEKSITGDDWDTSGYFDQAHGVDVGPDGLIYVADLDHDRIQVCTPTGDFVRILAEGQLTGPAGIAVSANGNIFVTVLQGSPSVCVLDTNGNQIATWGTQGSGDDQLDRPKGICVGPDGRIYVADTFNSRIQVFQPDGTSVQSVPLTFRPEDVAVSSSDELIVVGHFFVRVYNMSGTELRSWNPGGGRVCAVALGPAGSVYVACDAHGVKEYTTSGSLVAAWGTDGNGDGQFRSPHGIAVVSDAVYVSDSTRNDLQRFDLSGNFQWSAGSSGTTAGFADLQDVLVTSNALYTVDRTSRYLRKLSRAGDLDWMLQLGRSEPTAIAEDSDGNIYVCHSMGNYVSVVDENGEFLRGWGTAGSSDGQFNRPQDICMSVEQEVYVADGNNHRIQVFDTNGTFLRKWGENGTAPGQLSNPKGVVVNPDGNVYVSCNNGIQAFTPQGQFIREVASRAGQPLDCDSTGLLYSGNYLYTTDGRLVAGIDVPTLKRAFIGDDGGWWIANRISLDIYRRAYRTFGLNPPTGVPEVGVLNIEQRAGYPYLDIDYVVADEDSPSVTVAALAFDQGITDLDHLLPVRTFAEGTQTNIGPGIIAGERHRLTWSVAADWDTDFGQVSVELLVNDGRGLIDAHYITIPSNGPDPELIINRSPVQQDDLFSAWLWLLATDDPEVQLRSGAIVSAVSTNVVYASGTTTTEAGRTYLFGRMGVREATANEIQRAKEASTAGTISQWDPRKSVGPGLRPIKVNEYSFDTGATTGWWMVPNP